MNLNDQALINLHLDIDETYERWLPDFGIDNFVKTEFTCGACYSLALALHHHTNWPIMASLDGDDIVHCYVINPSGKAVDIYGVRSTDKAPTRYDPDHDCFKYKTLTMPADSKVDPDDSYYQWAVQLIALFPDHFGLFDNFSLIDKTV